MVSDAVLFSATFRIQFTSFRMQMCKLPIQNRQQFMQKINIFFSFLFSSFPVESLNNGHLSISPPQNNAQMQRESTTQVTQPSSVPSSPLASPGAQSSLSFNMPKCAYTIDTGDPNWQATKSTVRERNAAMFNNELMSDISFVVGSDGKKKPNCDVNALFKFI